jgi:putative transposase
MNRIPKAVYTKECREEAVKLAMTVLSRCWEVDQVSGRLEHRVESLHTLVAKPDICGYRSANVSKATASDEYQALLKHHVVCSMSRKGNRWDNAAMERFFLNLKMERVWQRQYVNHDEARRDINQYIIAFYNPVRLHSTLGYLSPAAYEAKPTLK